jgi:hypothetical protein
MNSACAVFSFVACQALQYFSSLSHTRKDFRKKKIIKHKMCVLIFNSNYFFSETFFILRRAEQVYDHKYSYIGLRVITVILVSF